MSVEAVGSSTDDLFISDLPNTHPSIAIPVPMTTESTMAPATNILADMIDSRLKRERLNNDIVDFFKRCDEELLAEYEAIQAEQQKAIEEEAKLAKSKSTWNAVSVVSQYITSVGTILLGAGAGGLVGGLLIASGVIGIGMGIAHDTNLLQPAISWYTKSEELQEKISQRIYLGAFILQMGLGLAGGAIAWKTGALAAAQISQDGIMSTITVASSVSAAGAQVCKAYYEKKRKIAEKQIKDYRTDITENQFNSSSTTRSILDTILSDRDQNKVLGDLIKNSTVSLD